MKKLKCACMIIALAGAYAFAGDVAEVTTKQGFTTLYEVKDSLNALAVGGTLTNGLAVTGGELSNDGKATVVGGDNTTGLMVQAASVTATSSTVQTNTFAVAFGAVPVVTTTYTEDPGDVRSLFLGTITASNFLCTVTSSKNYAYIAVGTRP